MGLATVLVLSLCLSADGLGVGFSYGAKGVRVPLACVTLVSAISAATFLASSMVGAGVERLVGDWPARVLGAVILAGLGVWLIRDALRERAEVGKVDGDPGAASHHRGQLPADEVWAVVRRPETADLDRSGTISLYEAALLGLALAVDSAGAGAGATLAGSPPWWSCFAVAAVNAAFLLAGLWLGRSVAAKVTMAKAARALETAATQGQEAHGATARSTSARDRLALAEALLPGLALICVALLDLVI